METKFSNIPTTNQMLIIIIIIIIIIIKQQTDKQKKNKIFLFLHNFIFISSTKICESCSEKLKASVDKKRLKFILDSDLLWNEFIYLFI